MVHQEITDLFQGASLAPQPLVKLDDFGSDQAQVWMKQEWLDPESNDPLRSIKRKPSRLLFQDVLEKRYMDGDMLLISATSGNFGIEVGLMAGAKGLPFIAIVPAAVPEYNLRVLQTLGINTVKTEEQETCPREFTVFFARAYSHEFHHRLVNIEQYYSFLNPVSHCLTTGKEIFEGLDQVDAVVASVGSCGTISGILQYIIATDKKTKVIGVQPVVQQGVPGTHIIKGDCRWSPENFSPLLLPGGQIVVADNVDAYAFTAKLWEQGIPAGPSTGMALAQAYKMIEAGEIGNIVILSPDNNFKYGDLIVERLTTLKKEITERYPELKLSSVIEDYMKHFRKQAGLEWTLERVRECYPAKFEGKIFHVKDIEDIVTGQINIPAQTPTLCE